MIRVVVQVGAIDFATETDRHDAGGHGGVSWARRCV